MSWSETSKTSARITRVLSRCRTRSSILFLLMRATTFRQKRGEPFSEPSMLRRPSSRRHHSAVTAEDFLVISYMPIRSVGRLQRGCTPLLRIARCIPLKRFPTAMKRWHRPQSSGCTRMSMSLQGASFLSARSRKTGGGSVDVYRRAGANLGLVVGRLSWRQVETTISQARTGTLDGLVCVAGLIEGFDLPTLRLAAYHRPQRRWRRRCNSSADSHDQAWRSTANCSPSHWTLPRSWRRCTARMPPGKTCFLRSMTNPSKRSVRSVSTSIKLIPVVRSKYRPGDPTRPRRTLLRVAADELDLDVDPPRLGGTEVVWRFYSEETDLLALVTLRRHPRDGSMPTRLIPGGTSFISPARYANTLSYSGVGRQSHLARPSARHRSQSSSQPGRRRSWAPLVGSRSR